MEHKWKKWRDRFSLRSRIRKDPKLSREQTSDTANSSLDQHRLLKTWRKEGVFISEHNTYLLWYLLSYTCPVFSKNHESHKEVKKKLSKETKHWLQPYSLMAPMLALSDRKFKITMTSMSKALVTKIDSMQNQISNSIRDVETIWKNQMERLEMKSTVMEMRSVLDGLIRKKT